jgi:hypothetical protein
MQVDHVAARGCVTLTCCNPAHLEAVTNAENSRRGRAAKLDHETVAEIRRRVDEGESRRAVARDIGLDASTVSRAYAGATWH